ncbi:MAG: hypothetical protein MH213_07060 [Marinobacter sp.]|nr:hypothetical protein [Marinobacter sp.]
MESFDSYVNDFFDELSESDFDLSDEINSIKQDVSDTLTDVYQGASSEVSDALVTVEQFFDQITQQAADNFIEFSQNLGDQINAAEQAVADTLTDAADALNTKVEEYAQDIANFEQELTNTLVDLEQDVADAISEAYQNAINEATAVIDDMVNVYDQISDFATATTNDVNEFFDNLADNISDSFIEFSQELGDELNDIGDTISDFFNFSQSVVQRRDPLTLDLDDDGLETVGIDLANPILFDHDGDGNKAATGWIKPDDGFLVLDRNGNGTIDDGTELFGDSTPLNDGSGNAEDGFAALVQEDTNGDGIVDANDANFANLRVWQDLNSDGISQADELKTLDEAGVASINVAKTENSQPLANGNLLADIGSYVRSDGSSSDVGSVSAELGDIDLAENTFISQFTDTIPLTPEAEALPDMNGSGQVRNLREAASLSPTLAALLTQYDAATTRDEQLALLDELLTEWSQTSELAVTGDGAYDGLPTNISVSGFAEGTAGYDEWINKLQILERFNGRTFVSPADSATEVNLNFFAARRNFLDQSYASLRLSVYDGLLLQTRLEPYISSFRAEFGNIVISVDFSGTDIAFQTRFDEAPGEAVRDLLDMQRIVGTNITRMGWDGLGQLRGWLASTTVDGVDPTLQPELVSALNDFGYSGFRINGDGTNASEVVIGDDTGTVLNGLGGNDLLLGGAGDDTLNGGTGNDTLYGGDGNDTYQLNLGDGHDTILETHGDTGIDTLQFGSATAYTGQLPITAGDISIAQEGDALVFRHINGRDSVTVAHWFAADGGKHTLDTIAFAAGRTFDLTTLQLGTINADVLTALATTPGGVPLNQILAGGAGNDTLIGGEGNDWLLGGAGADSMSGGTGNDTYSVDNAGDIVIENLNAGVDVVEASISTTLTDNVENLTLVGTGAIAGTGNALDNVITGNAADNHLQGMDGNDTLIGNAGNDTLDGGAGADTMIGGTGNDSYIVDTLADTIIEQIGQGTDTVKTGLAYTLGNNLENLTLTGQMLLQEQAMN